MIPKEIEPAMDLVVPKISSKTSPGQLEAFSKQRWQNDGRRRVAADMVMNGKELLAGSNIDWKDVLGRMRVQHGSTLQFGEAALAVYDAPMVGGFAAVGGWAMHDPPIVYLSGKCLANRAGVKLEDFKSRMRQEAIDYGQKVLPHANLYVATLDFLLEVRERNKYRHTLNKLVSLLKSGDIEEAYKIMRSHDDLVRTRG